MCGCSRWAIDDPVGSLADPLDELVTAQAPAFGNEVWVLLEDLLVQAAERCGWVDAQVLSDPVAHSLEGGERLCLST